MTEFETALLEKLENISDEIGALSEILDEIANTLLYATHDDERVEPQTVESIIAKVAGRTPADVSLTEEELRHVEQAFKQVAGGPPVGEPE